MVTHYLRLDLYFKDNGRYKISDRINLEHNEDIYETLKVFDDDYVNLVDVLIIGDVVKERVILSFKRTKLKNKGYNWLVCDLDKKSNK